MNTLTFPARPAFSLGQDHMAGECHHGKKRLQIQASSDHNIQMLLLAAHQPSARASQSASALLAHPPAYSRAAILQNMKETFRVCRFLCGLSKHTRKESSSSSHLTKATTSSMFVNDASCTSFIRKRIKSPCFSTSVLICGIQMKMGEEKSSEEKSYRTTLFFFFSLQNDIVLSLNLLDTVDYERCFTKQSVV